MDPLLIAIAFAPLLLLIFVLVRYAGRIRRDVVDQEHRTIAVDQLKPAIVRFVLERDHHTCQRCGSKTHVGVDFTGQTPEDGSSATPNQLEATCAECFLGQWKTLKTSPNKRA
jgi:5-methylcytosine-specific restriction endonuclease McrA